MDTTEGAIVPGPISSDMDNLQGAWIQTAYERDGILAPTDERGWQPIVTIKGDTFEVRLADGTNPYKGTFRLDPARDPKTIDWLETLGEDAGKTLFAIYTLEGDQFVFCAAYPGNERPKEFTTHPGQVMRVHRREIGFVRT